MQRHDKNIASVVLRSWDLAASELGLDELKLNNMQKINMQKIDTNPILNSFSIQTEISEYQQRIERLLSNGYNINTIHPEYNTSRRVPSY
ncbi:MAG TPA: hypothetical protein VJN02_07740 [Gammaproteobacteria bacterium]|nr:hypothetical protein [Gammaproteobacteria bacterium]